MADTLTDADAPEFHIVVRRPRRPGPLGPYRFTITTAFAAVVTGAPLWRSLETGVGIDAALIRTGVASLLMWVLAGHVNRILASGASNQSRPTSPTSPTVGDTATTDAV